MLGGSNRKTFCEHYSSGGAKGYATNRLGSVLNGDLAGTSRSYGLFGEVLNPQTLAPTSSPVRYGHSGYEFEAETGHYKTPYRTYNPTTGRWLQQEPVDFDGPNYYWGLANNPLSIVDPSGLRNEQGGGAVGGPGPGVGGGGGRIGPGGGGVQPPLGPNEPGWGAAISAGLVSIGRFFGLSNDTCPTPVEAGGNRGERNKSGNPSGTDNPFKKMVPDPDDPTKVIYKDPHTGKPYKKQKPEGFDDWWKKKHGNR